MHLSTGFYWGSCYSIFSFILCMFCRLLFVLFYFFFWPLCCLFFFDIRILITPLVSFGHCVVCSSSIYGFWLPLWYLLAIVLSVLLRYTDSDYPFGIFWPLCCLFLFDIRILITPLVSFGHCVVCSSSIYGFWLPLWYLLAIVLSVLLRYTDSDYPFGIFWPLCCLFFFDIRILITPLVSFGHCVVCSSSIYGFWLPLWYLLAIVLSVLLRYTDSDYLFGIFWPLCCLSFFDIRILITPLVSFGHCVVCSSSIYDSDYPFGIFCPLCCLSFFDIGILITLWYLLAIVLSVLLRYTDSDYPFGIFKLFLCLCMFCRSLFLLLYFFFWPLCCLSFFDIRILITPLVSSNSSYVYVYFVDCCLSFSTFNFDHCVVSPSSIYGFWLPLWYLQTLLDAV